MKTLLHIPVLFLISTFGYLHAQCPVTVETNTESTCLYITWQEGQEIPDTITVGESVYAMTSTGVDFAIYTDTLFEGTCAATDTITSEALAGILDYMVDTFSYACEFSAEGYLPPCPQNIFMVETQSCLLLSIDTENDAQLTDSVHYDELTYDFVSTDVTSGYHIYSQNGTPCDVETMTPLNGVVNIGLSGCSYEDGLLPITILSFDYTDNDGVIELSWSVNSEEPTRMLHLQKSYDGVDWNDVYEQNLTGYAAGQTMKGEFNDREVEQPQVYYRLYISDISGESTYSNILPVATEDHVVNSIFYQSQSRSIMIKAGQNYSGEMFLFNTQGQNVLTRDVQMQKNTFQVIDVQGHLTPGIYFVKFDNGLIPPSKIFID